MQIGQSVIVNASGRDDVVAEVFHSAQMVRLKYRNEWVAVSALSPAATVDHVAASAEYSRMYDNAPDKALIAKGYAE